MSGTVLAATAQALPTAHPQVARCPTTPQPGVGIRLAEAPTALKDDPRAQLYVIDHVNPGATITRRIGVSNGTDRTVTLQLYPAAASVENGAFTVVEGRSTNELTSWTSVTPGAVILAPGECADASVRIVVPGDASAGERYAVALAELPAQQSAPGTVAVASRVGVRIYLSVGPGGAPRSDFAIEALTASRTAAGEPRVQATVRNTGGRALDLSGSLLLTEGPGSLTAGPFNAKLGTTLEVGGSAPVLIPLDRSLPDGPWRARLTLRSGETERTATAVITFPFAPGASASPVPVEAAAGKGSALPLVGAGVLGLLLLLLLFLLRRRRKQDEPTVEEVRAALAAARRAGSQAELERMALALHRLAPGIEPLDALLEALSRAGTDRGDLLRAAASYGQPALLANPRLPALPVDVAAALGERVAAGPKANRRR